MKIIKKQTMILLFSLAVVFFSSGCQICAETSVPFQMIHEEKGENYLVYPQLQHMANTFVQEQINQAILHNIQFHYDLFQVSSADEPAIVRLDAVCSYFSSNNGHDVISILFSVEGRMPTGRTGHRLIPLTYDLGNGQAVTAENIFVNAEEAQIALEELTLDALADDLSNYIDIGALTPFPIERFVITEDGLTFAYPDNSLVWLSGKSASLHFLFYEMMPLLNLQAEGILGNLVDFPLLHSEEIDRETIIDMIEGGSLPGIPAKLGNRLDVLLEQFPVLYDPEGFPNGASFQLEDDVFRGMSIITQKSKDTVNGFISKRMNLYGIVVGTTSQDYVISVLGQPDISLSLSSEAANLYGVSPGTMDIYLFGNELRLIYDRESTLAAIWLCIAE